MLPSSTSALRDRRRNSIAMDVVRRGRRWNWIIFRRLSRWDRAARGRPKVVDFASAIAIAVAGTGSSKDHLRHHPTAAMVRTALRSFPSLYFWAAILVSGQVFESPIRYHVWLTPDRRMRFRELMYEGEREMLRKDLISFDAVVEKAKMWIVVAYSSENEN